MKTDIRIIKRYANRKLYDTRTAMYVTLHEVLSMYQTIAHEKICVIDARTGNEITDDTLIQALITTQLDNPEFRETLLSYLDTHEAA